MCVRLRARLEAIFLAAMEWSAPAPDIRTKTARYQSSSIPARPMGLS
jgi:hypothetical protein